MVEGGAASFEQAHAAAGVKSGGSDGALELSPADMVRTGAGDQKATGVEHFERTQVELLVSAHGPFDGALGFGEGRRIEHDGVEFLAGVRPVAQDLEGVTGDPFDFGFHSGAVGFVIPLGDLEGGVRGIDAGYALADLGEVERKAALVTADIQGAAGGTELLGPCAGSGVVVTLVEKCAGFLAGVGVELEAEAVELEMRAAGCLTSFFDEQGLGVGGAQSLEFAHAGVGALQNGRGGKFFAEHGDAGRTHGVRIKAFGEELEDDQVAVFVDYQAGDLVRLTETEAAGVGLVVEEAPTAGDGLTEARCEQQEPGGLVDGLAGDHAERDLRGRAVERGAQQQSARVGYGEQGRGRVFCPCRQGDGLDVRGVDP